MEDVQPFNKLINQPDPVHRSSRTRLPSTRLTDTRCIIDDQGWIAVGPGFMEELLDARLLLKDTKVAAPLTFYSYISNACVSLEIFVSLKV
jgi:hypothetical protein